MIKILFKDLKKNDWFILKPIEEPKNNQVWVKGEYDKSSKTYSATNFNDINKERFFKGNKEVYIDFTF